MDPCLERTPLMLVPAAVNLRVWATVIPRNVGVDSDYDHEMMVMNNDNM